MCGTWSGESVVAVLTGAALAMRVVVGRELAHRRSQTLAKLSLA
jgi:hypothetical protein